jgi:molybdopterin converting factor small subunit
LDQKFKDEMVALSKDASTETTYAELYSVLQTYATLSDTEKASVATEYATLQQLIENYNTKSQVANTELAEATEIAFAPIVATGFAFLAALWFLLKKKFFI